MFTCISELVWEIQTGANKKLLFPNPEMTAERLFPCGYENCKIMSSLVQDLSRMNISTYIQHPKVTYIQHPIMRYSIPCSMPVFRIFYRYLRGILDE